MKKYLNVLDGNNIAIDIAIKSKYNEVYTCIENLIKQTYHIAKLKDFLGKKYNLFIKILLENIQMACENNLDYLINDGYIIYLYEQYSIRGSKYSDDKKNIMQIVEKLAIFSKKYDISVVYRELVKYFRFIKTNIMKLYLWRHLNDNNFNCRCFFLKSVDKRLVYHINNCFIDDSFKANIVSVKNDSFKRYILDYLYIYLYLNKIDVSYLDVVQKLDFDLIEEDFVLNNLNAHENINRASYEYLTDLFDDAIKEKQYKKILL